MEDRTRKLWRTQKFVQLAFQGYYRSSQEKVDIPEKVGMREFGMETFQQNWYCSKRKTETRLVLSKHVMVEKKEIGCGERGSELIRSPKCPKCGTRSPQWNNWSRHLGFGSREELLRALADVPPQAVYHSAAFYQVPVATRMEEKGWQYAELVFDIDADHLNSPCAKKHDAWVCRKPGCSGKGVGAPPEKCPECGGTSLFVMKWLCDECLRDAKAHAVKLYDEFLVDDFGIDVSHIQLNYSGHRGYHVRVNNPSVMRLDSNARVEIVQFVLGMGIASEKMVVARADFVALPSRRVPGWGGRIADALIEFIRNIDDYTGKEKWVEPLKERRKEAIEGLSRNPPILSTAVKGIGPKSWQEIAAKAIDGTGPAIDMPVTHDIHRVIRLIGSLNGKTGFIATKLSRDAIADFDPFLDATAFEGEIKVLVPPLPLDVPRFRIGDQTYGPYNDEPLTLPSSAAMFLLCKGVATVD